MSGFGTLADATALCPLSGQTGHEADIARRQLLTHLGHWASAASEVGCVPFLTRRPVAKC